MSGGKGGSSTTQVTIPPWLEEAAQTNLARADVLSTIGYTPYYGPDVAALTPMQQAAMQSTNMAASAFGMPAPVDPMAGMPQAQDFGGGVYGYSSAPLYQGSVSALQAAAPGQYAALLAPFIDPITGKLPNSPFGPLVKPTSSPYDYSTRNYGSGGQSSTGTEGGNYGGAGGNQPSSSSSGGYTSFGDMFDGGGPGTSGSTFSGGPLSGTLNTVGVSPIGSSKMSPTSQSSSGMGGGK